MNSTDELVVMGAAAVFIGLVGGLSLLPLYYEHRRWRMVGLAWMLVWCAPPLVRLWFAMVLA